MAYVSNIPSSMPIIDESNAHLYAPDSDITINGKFFGRGLELPRSRAHTFGEGLSEYKGQIYSRDEIFERIKEREQRGKTMRSIVQKKKIPTSDQNGTNYCWTYGVVTAINCMRAWRNMPYVEFSRESVAAVIKGYRNNGGWGEEALKHIVKYGLMPQNLWPKHYLRDGKYNTEENKKIALNYRVTEFEFLPDRNFLAEMSALCDYNAVAVGFNKWSHEVCSIDPVIVGSNTLGRMIWNSWTDSYGDKGMAVLTEGYGPADDAVVPIVMVAE